MACRWGRTTLVTPSTRERPSRHRRDSEQPRRGEDHDTGCTKPPAGKFVQVQAGNAFSCGLRPSGLVECWGNDRKGQSTPPDGVQFLQIATSNVVDHACGLTLGARTRGRRRSTSLFAKIGRRRAASTALFCHSPSIPPTRKAANHKKTRCPPGPARIFQRAASCSPCRGPRPCVVVSVALASMAYGVSRRWRPNRSRVETRDTMLA